MQLDLDWEFVADTVMGGVSQGRVTRETVDGRDAARLTGQVSLDNDGGFIQMAADLDPYGRPVDLSAYSGLTFDAFGNGESYELRLRTADLTRPWQSYRMSFTAPPRWTRVTAPFAELDAHRTDAPFDPARVRRLGILAVGRAFAADVAITGLALLTTKP
ncbi:CIA30 family protein [Jannaschia ovalis]|uniref:CIA30 family protein n=1 Tax=Jannaschia ovalis TaxID=3038773 RepID=A0ABY8L8F7_9RHOB|nr:CIA30 family protein [Jannaschia sp. GRR-S6-38]WGH77371.1 CIA30 family protein [Jannaschia sp. GRR-S6-38]